MSDEAELLRRYADEGAEGAFVALVERHVDLVYSAAVRRLGGDVHLAQDVTQEVFTVLARKARTLRGHPVLSGWLCQTTRFAANRVMRTEQRRQVREQEAGTMQEIVSDQAPEFDWRQLRPVLDAVMDDLTDREREAVLLRFFEGRPFADVGQVLQLSEDGARTRVNRALEKMRQLLERRRRWIANTSATSTDCSAA